MATIKDIAQRAGVSLGTVDRVLHNRGRVAPETAEKVRAIAAELAFAPNLFARNLSTQKAYTLGVLMPRAEQDSGYWDLPLQGLQEGVHQHRAYQVNLVTRHFDRYDAQDCLAQGKSLLKEDLDALIVAPILADASLRILDSLDPERHLPVVTFDTALDHPRVRCHIGQDSYKAGTLAARLIKLLVKPGHNLALLAPDATNLHQRRRIDGFLKTLGTRDYRVVQQISPHQADREHYLFHLRGLLTRVPDLQGLVVNDATTHLVAWAIKELGRPHTALIGYDLLPQDGVFLADGSIDFLIDQDPHGQGLHAVRCALDLALGQPVQPHRPMPLNIITKENWEDWS